MSEALTDRELAIQGGDAPSGTTEWTEVTDGTANAVATLTHAATVGQRHYVTGWEAVTKGAALGNDVVVELREGATVKWRSTLGNTAVQGERTGVMYPRALEFASGIAVTLTAEAGGALVIITLSMLGYTT